MVLLAGFRNRRRKEKIFMLSGRDFRNYSIIIVRNKCIDLLRKEGRSVNVEEDVILNIPSNEASIEDQAILQDDYIRMRSYLAALDLASRQVLEMKYVLGMSYQEVGAELGITAKHVDTKIMRAKANIRKMLEKEAQGNEV